MAEAKGGKKNRKYGNKKKGAIIYMAENRKSRNKKRKLIRHINHHPTDSIATAAAQNHFNLIIGT